MFENAVHFQTNFENARGNVAKGLYMYHVIAQASPYPNQLQRISQFAAQTHIINMFLFIVCLGNLRPLLNGEILKN